MKTLNQIYKLVIESILLENNNSIDYQKYLYVTPKTVPGCEYYDLRIPVGITPPNIGDSLVLDGVNVVVQTVSTPEDIEAGRGGLVAKSMREHGIGFAVNCLPEGHEWLKNIT
jgi:hypothetical protein